jgi:hypothetical protein
MVGNSETSGCVNWRNIPISLTNGMSQYGLRRLRNGCSTFSPCNKSPWEQAAMGLLERV